MKVRIMRWYDRDVEFQDDEVRAIILERADGMEVAIHVASATEAEGMFRLYAPDGQQLSVWPQVHGALLVDLCKQEELT